MQVQKKTVVCNVTKVKVSCEPIPAPAAQETIEAIDAALRKKKKPRVCPACGAEEGTPRWSFACEETVRIYGSG